MKKMFSRVLPVATAALVLLSGCGGTAEILMAATEPPGPPEPVERQMDTLQAQFDADLAAGGTSFYVDRLLVRPGLDPAFHTAMNESYNNYGHGGYNGLMTRGRALYVMGIGEGTPSVNPGNLQAGSNNRNLVREFGIDGDLRYVKGIQRGYTIRVNDQSAFDFLEDTSKRMDYPSYWESYYKGRGNSANNGLYIHQKRFITENNIAVTLLEIENTAAAAKTVNIVLKSSGNCSTPDGDVLTGIYTVDRRNISIKLSMDDGNVTGNTTIARTLVIPANGTQTVKAQMGFIDPHRQEAVDEWDTYNRYDGTEAFKAQLYAYNYWWVENIPNIRVPDDNIHKLVFYRWWIARFNTHDATTYNYPFPTSIEGVYGYNNAIINALPWQMDDLRYMRNPLAAYGTWANAAIAAVDPKPRPEHSRVGMYFDNPVGVWDIAPQQYISWAAWNNYKIHGGTPAFLKSIADAGARDADATKQQLGHPGRDGLYGMQYDAWDEDTISLSDGAGDRGQPMRRFWQERIDTASLSWANATATSQMYRYAGDTANADKYKQLADSIQAANIGTADNPGRIWDPLSRQFLMRYRSNSSDPNMLPLPNGASYDMFIPLRDINNYYQFMFGMVPGNQGFEEALNVFGTSVFPFWPLYVAGIEDYNKARLYDGGWSAPFIYRRTLHYAPSHMSLTLKMFANAIRNYDVDSFGIKIDGSAYRDLLNNYTWIHYIGYEKNGNKYPDSNEFFNGDPRNPGFWRSWIHHDWHSQYLPLIIEDVMGMKAREDRIVELHPIDIGWDTFSVSEIKYHGHDLKINWDKDDGYALFIDGTEVAKVDRLAHFEWNSQTGDVTVKDSSAANVLANRSLPIRSAAEVVYANGRVKDIMDYMENFYPGADRPSGAGGDESIGTEFTPLHNGTYELVVRGDANKSWEVGRFDLDFGVNHDDPGRGGGDQHKRSQMFTAHADVKMTGVQVRIRNYNAQYPVTVELFDSENAASPPGNLLASTAIPMTHISNEFTYINVPMEWDLLEGRTYHIVLGQDGGIGDFGIFKWQCSSIAWQNFLNADQVTYRVEQDNSKTQIGTPIGNLTQYKRAAYSDPAWYDDTVYGNLYLKVFFQTP